MQRVFRAVAPELPLDQFVGRYVLGQIDQGFPVLQLPDTDSPQPLLGMMTLRDLRRFQLSEWAFTHVGEAMTPFHRLRALPPGMPAGEAFRTLLESWRGAAAGARWRDAAGRAAPARSAQLYRAAGWFAALARLLITDWPISMRLGYA